MGRFGKFKIEDAVFQRRVDFRAVHIRRQVNGSKDLIRAPLGVDRLSFCALFLGFVFAGDREPVPFDADIEFLGRESRHFGPDGQGFIGLRYFQMKWMQDFGLGLQPIRQVVAEPPAVVIEDFKGSFFDRIENLLEPIDSILGPGLFGDCR